MARETIEKFNGLYTAADDYSTPGSPDMNDWDIDLNHDLKKTVGYTRIEPQASVTASAYLPITSIINDNPCMLAMADADDYFEASSTVMFYDFSDSEASSLLGNKYWNITAATPGFLTVEGCDASGLSFATSHTAKADPSCAYLHGFCSAGVGIEFTAVESQGAYYDSTDDIIYSFLANNTEDKAYLVNADKDVSNWRFAEGSGIASATVFETTEKAWFKKYKNDIIFTKGETISANAFSMTTTGGTFYLTGSQQIRAYGETNNPTGKYLEVHKDRLWVGNISKASSETQLGKSWVQVSKLFPENTDTQVSLVNSGIVFGEGTAKVIVPGHSFKVGDEIYLSGVTFSGVQDDMNQRLHTVVGLNGSGVIIEYNNVNDLAWDTTASNGDALLRGPTWGTSLLIYDDLLEGAGLFRCDDNQDDAVMQLKSSFGSLAILRQQNPYIFTGAIESGNQTLARPLNVPFGTVSPFTFLTAGGVWFVSQYGISKIEGTTIKTNQNQLDNIVDVTVAEPIKPTFDAISTKSGLVVYAQDRKLLVHDPDTDITYVFDTLLGTWTRWYDRLVDRYMDIGEDIYTVYKHFIFKTEDGNLAYSLKNYAEKNISSSYKTKIMDQGNDTATKIYNFIYSLIEGSATSSATNQITINVYYNGSAVSAFSFGWDVKTGEIITWDSLTTSGTASWNTVTTTGTVTWGSITSTVVAMLQNRKYRCGSGRHIQLEIQHSDDSSVKISRVLIDYDTLDVDTQQ